MMPVLSSWNISRIYVFRRKNNIMHIFCQQITFLYIIAMKVRNYCT